MTLLGATALLVSPQLTAAQDPPERISFSEGDERFAGKGTELSFPRDLSFEGPRDRPVVLRALGSGVRKKMMFTLYEGVAYAQVGSVLGSVPARGYIEGDFTKHISMTFVRDVDSRVMREAYDQGISRALDERTWSPELQVDLDRFLGQIPDRSMREGETVEVTWVPGWGLYLKYADQTFPPIDNTELARLFWTVWFGDEPVSADLKRDMLRFVEGNGTR